MLSLSNILEILTANVVDSRYQEDSQTHINCRWRVLCWFIAFTIRFRKPNRKNDDDKVPESSINEDSASTETYTVSSNDERNAQFESWYFTAEIVRFVLYSTKDNVLCLHEVLRQVSISFTSFLLFIKLVL